MISETQKHSEDMVSEIQKHIQSINEIDSLCLKYEQFLKGLDVLLKHSNESISEGEVCNLVYKYFGKEGEYAGAVLAKLLKESVLLIRNGNILEKTTHLNALIKSARTESKAEELEAFYVHLHPEYKGKIDKGRIYEFLDKNRETFLVFR